MCIVALALQTNAFSTCVNFHNKLLLLFSIALFSFTSWMGYNVRFNIARSVMNECDYYYSLLTVSNDFSSLMDLLLFTVGFNLFRVRLFAKTCCFLYIF